MENVVTQTFPYFQLLQIVINKLFQFEGSLDLFSKYYFSRFLLKQKV